jgi:hypothetical protein
MNESLIGKNNRLEGGLNNTRHFAWIDRETVIDWLKSILTKTVAQAD